MAVAGVSIMQANNSGQKALKYLLDLLFVCYFLNYQALKVGNVNSWKSIIKSYGDERITGLDYEPFIFLIVILLLSTVIPYLLFYFFVYLKYNVWVALLLTLTNAASIYTNINISEFSQYNWADYIAEFAADIIPLLYLYSVYLCFKYKPWNTTVVNPASVPQSEKVTMIEKIDLLKEQGILTQKEYNEQKKKILNL